MRTSSWFIEDEYPGAVKGQDIKSVYVNDHNRSLPDLNAGFRLWSSDRRSIPTSYFSTESGIRMSSVNKFNQEQQNFWVAADSIAYGNIPQLKLEGQSDSVTVDGVPIVNKDNQNIEPVNKNGARYPFSNFYQKDDQEPEADDSRIVHKPSSNLHKRRRNPFEDDNEPQPKYIQVNVNDMQPNQVNVMDEFDEIDSSEFGEILRNASVGNLEKALSNISTDEKEALFASDSKWTAWGEKLFKARQYFRDTIEGYYKERELWDSKSENLSSTEMLDGFMESDAYKKFDKASDAYAKMLREGAHRLKLFRDNRKQVEENENKMIVDDTSETKDEIPSPKAEEPKPKDEEPTTPTTNMFKYPESNEKPEIEEKVPILAPPDIPPDIVLRFWNPIKFELGPNPVGTAEGFNHTMNFFKTQEALTIYMDQLREWDHPEAKKVLAYYSGIFDKLPTRAQATKKKEDEEAELQAEEIERAEEQRQVLELAESVKQKKARDEQHMAYMKAKTAEIEKEAAEAKEQEAEITRQQDALKLSQDQAQYARNQLAEKKRIFDERLALEKAAEQKRFEDDKVAAENEANRKTLIEINKSYGFSLDTLGIVENPQKKYSFDGEHAGYTAQRIVDSGDTGIIEIFIDNYENGLKELVRIKEMGGSISHSYLEALKDGQYFWSTVKANMLRLYINSYQDDVYNRFKATVDEINNTHPRIDDVKLIDYADFVNSEIDQVKNLYETLLTQFDHLTGIRGYRTRAEEKLKQLISRMEILRTTDSYFARAAQKAFENKNNSSVAISSVIGTEAENKNVDLDGDAAMTEIAEDDTESVASTDYVERDINLTNLVKARVQVKEDLEQLFLKHTPQNVDLNVKIKAMLAEGPRPAGWFDSMYAPKKRVPKGIFDQSMLSAEAMLKARQEGLRSSGIGGSGGSVLTQARSSASDHTSRSNVSGPSLRTYNGASQAAVEDVQTIEYVVPSSRGYTRSVSGDSGIFTQAGTTISQASNAASFGTQG